ncbi:MAG: hypothetical protein CfClM3_0952 [Methanobrevibacter sp. CfCl-M3]
MAAPGNIGVLHVGLYNVSVSFNGDADYNPSTSNTFFNVGERSNNGDGNDINTNGGGMDGSGNNDDNDNGFDQIFFKSLTGFPLILLVLLSVLGVYYWRRK